MRDPGRHHLDGGVDAVSDERLMMRHPPAWGSGGSSGGGGGLRYRVQWRPQQPYPEGGGSHRYTPQCLHGTALRPCLLLCSLRWRRSRRMDIFWWDQYGRCISSIYAMLSLSSAGRQALMLSASTSIASTPGRAGGDQSREIGALAPPVVVVVVHALLQYRREDPQVEWRHRRSGR